MKSIVCVQRYLNLHFLKVSIRCQRNKGNAGRNQLKRPLHRNLILKAETTIIFFNARYCFKFYLHVIRLLNKNEPLIHEYTDTCSFH